MRKQSDVRDISFANDPSRFAPPEEESRRAVDSAIHFDGQMTSRTNGEDRQLVGETERQASSRADGYDEDAVRRRAYERYLERNGGEGDAQSDWFAAEEEMRGRRLSAI